MGDDKTKEYDGGGDARIGCTTTHTEGRDDTIEWGVVAFYIVLKNKVDESCCRCRDMRWVGVGL